MARCLKAHWNDVQIAEKLLQKIGEVARLTIGDIDKQIGFDALKIFKLLNKEGFNFPMTSLFQTWGAKEKNPFVLPVCHNALYLSEESIYNSDEFIHYAIAECSRYRPSFPLLFLSMLLGNQVHGRVFATRRLIRAGLDPNEIIPTVRLKELCSKKLGHFDGSKLFVLFDLLEEITPLALAAAFKESDLTKELLSFGADPFLVSI